MSNIKNIDFELLFRRLTELFSIDGFEEPVLVHGGRMCVNVHIRCNQGSFFLKQYRQHMTEFVHEVKHAEKYFFDHGVPVILPIKDKYHRYSFWFDEFWFSLFPYIEGTIPDVNMSDVTIKSLGNWLGKIHKIGEKYPEDTFRRIRFWDKNRFYTQYLEIKHTYNQKVEKTKSEEEAMKFLETKEGIVRQNTFAPSDVERTNECLLHGDFIYTNVFIDTLGEISHVFDFEKAVKGPIGYEVARSMMINCFDNGWSDENINKAKKFINAYREIHALTFDEFSLGFRTYMTSMAHKGWIEGQIILMGSQKHDDILRAHAMRISHFNDNWKEFCRLIYY
ncbi:MAG: phosphotransferase [Patescibacteria group bacterium]